jgi:predicted kinase
MKLDHLKTPRIVLVFGKLCSGKGTYCANQYPDRVHIVTSNVVRQVSGAATRDRLQDTKQLDQAIAAELINQTKLALGTGRDVVIDGIRQRSIVEWITKEFGVDNVGIVWLDVPREELQRRYLNRKDAKDTQAFDQAYAKDEELGLAELHPWLNANLKVHTIPN